MLLAGASAIGGALLFAVPALLSSRHLQIAIFAAIYAMLGFGTMVQYSLAGQLSAANAASWGVAAFTVGLLTSSHGWPFLIAAAVAIGASVLHASTVGLAALRVGGHYLAIVTFAIAAGTYTIAQQTSWISNSGTGIFVTSHIELGPIDVASRVALWRLSVVVVAISAAGVWLLRSSPLGRRLIAVRENEDLAESLGISARTCKLIAFALSGLPIGFAGVLYAFVARGVTVEAFRVQQGILIIVIVVLGGARYLLGPIVGAAIIQFLPEILGADPARREMLYGLAIVVVVLLAPQGVVPLVSTTAARGSVEVRRMIERAGRR